MNDARPRQWGEILGGESVQGVSNKAVPPGANKDSLLASPIFYPFCSSDPTLYSCLIDAVSL
jgi:hypothetical protein